MKKKLLYLLFDNFNEKKYGSNIFFIEIKKKFNLKIIDIFFFKKPKIFKKKKNIYYPRNLQEINKFILKKNSTFISYLENNINTFKILNTIYKNNKKIYKVNNSAALEQYKIALNRNLFNNMTKLYRYIFVKKIFAAANIILIYLNLLPKFDIIFECSRDQIRKYNKIIYKKIVRIKSNSYDKLIYNKTTVEKKSIVFLDSNFCHEDRIFLDSNPSKQELTTYLHHLKNLFEKIEKEFNSRVIICLHPSSDEKIYKKIFKDNHVVKNQTDFHIKKAMLVLFHESSSVLDAILLNKKIINVQGKLMGKYFQYRNKVYSKKMDLKKIKLEDNFIIKKNVSIQKKNYLSFIKQNLTDDIKQYNNLKKINFTINSKSFKKLKKETGSYKTILHIL